MEYSTNTSHTHLSLYFHVDQPVYMISVAVHTVSFGQHEVWMWKCDGKVKGESQKTRFAGLSIVDSLHVRRITVDFRIAILNYFDYHCNLFH